MVSLVMVLLMVTTSAGAYAVATRRLRLRRADLPRALGAALECIGLAVVFLLLNAVIGVGVIIGVRALTGHFVSVYLMRDATMVLISGLQGLIFWCWWQRARGEAGRRAG
ncbi:MAG TPA: hypothetical protein VMT79_08830 [Candidatus Binatia bacterium]|nr:hypothetical protein [Candidatus Binatia bacterium]